VSVDGEIDRGWDYEAMGGERRVGERHLGVGMMTRGVSGVPSDGSSGGRDNRGTGGKAAIGCPSGRWYQQSS
jgi:hypothetical protein